MDETWKFSSSSLVVPANHWTKRKRAGSTVNARDRFRILQLRDEQLPGNLTAELRHDATSANGYRSTKGRHRLQAIDYREIESPARLYMDR